MESRDKYLCLTCREMLTQEEYEEHKKHGHVTVEYYEYPKREEDN